MPPRKKPAAAAGRQAKLAFGDGKLGIKKSSKADATSEDEFMKDQTDTDAPAGGKYSIQSVVRQLIPSSRPQWQETTTCTGDVSPPPDSHHPRHVRGHRPPYS